MRKSLLITSALGLVSALPTFAMANAAAAGSSSAACASGFFAQIDAKIMNAKLEIKNEKKTAKVEDNASLKEEDIIKDLKENFISNLANAEVISLFDFDFGANGPEKQAIRTAIAGYTLDQIGAETSTQLRTRLDATITVLVGTGIAAAAAVTDDMRNKLVASITTLRDLGMDAAIDKTTTIGRVLLERSKKVGDIDFIDRTAADNIAGVVARLTPDELTGAVVAGAQAAGQDFRGIKKIFVRGLNNSFGDAPLDMNAFKTAFQAAVKDPAFKTALDTTTAASTPFANLVKAERSAREKTNAQLDIRRGLPNLTDRRVHHHALAGGVGATAGWWQNMGGFAVSISGTGDYLWGTFRTMDDASGSPMKAEDKRKLGFGFQGDVGVHYVVSPSTTLGVLVGFRGQQLQFGRTDKTTPATNSKDSKGDYASKWMWNPVVSAQARTFFTDTVYGALTVGYVIPIERDYKLDKTNIDKDAKVRFQGLTGAFSVGMMF